MSEIVKINPAEYGLEENKAKQISDMFKPMLDKMAELEDEYNEVRKLEVNPETCQIAKELRMKYVKVRTGTAAIHKELKQFYLQGGRFVDGWKNAQLMASQGIEDKLKEIEDHYERIEAQRIAKLQEERHNELSKYIDEGSMLPGNLGEMAEEVWNNYLTGTKLNYEAKKAAEKKAQEERIAREKAERKEQERIRKENEKLRKEAEAREAQIKAEAEKRAREEAERRKKEEAERKIREEKERKEKAEYEAKMQAEREAREKIEAELKKKAEAEAKAKEAEESRIQAELNKGDAAKVRDLINDLEQLKTKYSFKSKKNKKMYSDVGLLIDKVLNHISK